MQIGREKTFLVLSQTYVPDPASVGQHMASLASSLARRGNRVVVFAANRGYEDPSIRYPSAEKLDGVEVHRFPLSSFGKQSILRRLIAGCIFVLQCMGRGIFVSDLQGIVVSTSPPMCSVAAVFLGALRRVPITYWVMDLNPDQIVAMGKLKPGSLPVRFFELLNRMILNRASAVVTLDRFMAQRVNQKVKVGGKMTVMPPWAHEDQLEAVPHERNPFRKQHGLDGKLVIMYSGNHALTNPLTTILQAAIRLKDRDDIVFMFVGGGAGKKEVEATITAQPDAHIRSLPYQPLSQIKYSLSAADVHLVTIGDAFVGIVHPCKVYGAMALGRPILLLGPELSHVSDLISHDEIGWHIRHGDVDGAVKTILLIAQMSPAQRDAMGSQSREIFQQRLTQKYLCGRLCDLIEQTVVRRSAEAANHPDSSVPAHFRSATAVRRVPADAG